MSIFAPPPVLVLNKEETLAAIKVNDYYNSLGLDKYKVNSPWICDLLDEFEKEGYVYNEWAQRKIEKAENLPAYESSGSTISLLIYNAQRYRASDKIIRAGFSPLNREMVELAIAQRKKIEVYSESIIGDLVKGGGYRPVINGEKAYVLAPRKRNKGFMADGTKAARIIFD